VFELRQTEIFLRWINSLRDQRVLALIVARLDRLALGHTGDVKPVGEGISELRLHFGPGYRVYFQRRNGKILLLLCGGDKSKQEKDIKRAKRVAAEWSNDDD
jgi:putative addiction module killer protein